MSSKKIMLVFGAGLALGTTAFAAGNGDMGQNSGRSQVSLQDLRDKCDAILKNPQMVKPPVDVVCEQTRIEWRQCAGSFDLTDNVQIRGSVGMKDWMAYAPFSQDSAKPQNCATFVKHQLYTKPVSEPMKCEDVLKSFKTDADLTSYCSTLISTRLKADPALQVDTATGDTFNTCSGSKFVSNVKGDQDQCIGDQSQGQGDQGQGDQGQGDQGQGDQGQGDQGQGDQGQGNGSQGQGDQGQGNQSQGQGNQSGQQGQGGGHDTSADAGH